VDSQGALPPDGPPDGDRHPDTPNDDSDHGALGSGDRPSGPPWALRNLWPVALLLAISAATLVVSAVTPSRPEAPPQAPEEADATPDGKPDDRPDEKPEDVIVGDPEGPFGMALRIVDSVLIGAGMLCVLLLFRLRVRRWLLPPPREAPRSTWGGEQLLYGILLAFGMLALTSAVGGLVSGGPAVVGALVQAAGQLSIALTVVALVVTRPAAFPDLFAPAASERPSARLARERLASLGVSGGHSGASALRGAVAFLAAFPLAVGAGWLGRLIHVALTGTEPAPHPVIERLAEAEALEIAALVGVACVVAPLCEELFFRGFLCPSIRDRFGVAAGVVASSLVFALVHLGLPNQMATFVLGVAFCLVYERSGTLVAPVVAHAIFNGVQLAYVLALRAAG